MVIVRSIVTAFSLACLLASFSVGCGDDGGAGGSAGDGGAGDGGAGDGGAGGSAGDGGAGNGGTGDGGGSQSEPAEFMGITARHNEVRANASPTPSSPLVPLTWSQALSEVASEHASRCVYEHSDNEYGENLYASAGGTPSPTASVDAWAEEVDDYDYANHSCSAICGHYTQIVWADSREVGCAMQPCNTGSPFVEHPSWYLVVCNYDPPGNYVGKRPY